MDQVFLVDKPNPEDWRKLLAYSRTWTDTGPHFYKRCQERADAEADPGMKHKLLRLSRKLKEVSCSFNSDMFSLRDNCKLNYLFSG